MPFLVPAPPPPFRKLLLPSVPQLPVVKSVKSFQHAGDIGDVIYALPTVRASGGGILYLCQESTHRVKPRDRMTPEKAESVASLLRLQPYLRDVRYAEKAFVGIDVDLNLMRTGMTAKYEHWLNLARCHLRYFGIPEEEDETAWLAVDYPVRVKDRSVVVARSTRYHNLEFPWPAVMKRYGDMMVFVGLPAEHEAFVKQVGKVDYHPTQNFLDLARVIAGAELFIGNQSAPRAVAEGLKVPVLVEGCGLCPNTNFIRPSATYIYANEKVPLPDVNDPARKQKPKLVMGGPVEGFTAYGQLFLELCRGMISRGIGVAVNRRSVSHHLTPAPEELLALDSTGSRPDVAVIGHNDLMLDDSLRGGELVVTMWESTRVVPKVIDHINRFARCVVVPSLWNAGTLDACGCNVPIRVVPLGIDPKVFSPRGSPGMATGVSFGTAARYSHGKQRKGLVEVGRAFLKAFPTETDVRLNYKIHPDCEFERVTDERVTYTAEFLDWSQMRDWYRGNTAYVSGSRGEGWGLHMHQAMSVGCCPIATRFGGQGEFFDSGVGRVLDCKQVKASGDYEGMGSWGEISEESMIREMRWVYENQREARKIGKKAAARAAEFTWERTVRELMNVLEEFGAYGQ